jgi:hypothetical protein
MDCVIAHEQKDLAHDLVDAWVIIDDKDIDAPGES